MRKDEKKVAKPYMSISNLSRQLNLSRNLILGYCKDHNIDTKKITPELAEGMKVMCNRNGLIDDVVEKVNSFSSGKINAKKLPMEKQATLEARLIDAKEQYNFNQELICGLQNEIEKYRNENGTLAVISSNGTAIAIPQMKNLEMYQKLNMSLRKQIDELESKLQLIAEGDIIDPFNE